jgi:hypothetical protein
VLAQEAAGLKEAVSYFSLGGGRAIVPAPSGAGSPDAELA